MSINNTIIRIFDVYPDRKCQEDAACRYEHEGRYGKNRHEQ